jgi:hypothetical protein
LVFLCVKNMICFVFLVLKISPISIKPTVYNTQR